MRVLRIAGLPDGALEAAAVFYADLPPPWGRGTILNLFQDGGEAPAGTPDVEGEDVVIVFPPADHTHRAWRLAAVQGLARDHAPLRVNALASDDPAAIASGLAYLEAAPGLTGQYLPLDSVGAGDVLTSAA